LEDTKNQEFIKQLEIISDEVLVKHAKDDGLKEYSRLAMVCSSLFLYALFLSLFLGPNAHGFCTKVHKINGAITRAQFD
jgi:hypothetical protein